MFVATFGFVLLSAPLWAQRGGGAHGGFAGHAAGSFHGGSVRSGTSFRAGAARSGGFGRGSGIRVRTGNPYRSRGFYGRGPYYPYGYYPYLGYGWDFDSYDDQNSDSGAYADTYADSYGPPPPYREDSGLQRDVQALNGKIDRLQADVEARNHPKQEQEPETALVFRDKHVEEVRNYAISGGTLWVLNEKAAKKIPLADLDLDATAKMNDDRGVDFRLPEPTMQLMIVR